MRVGVVVTAREPEAAPALLKTLPRVVASPRVVRLELDSAPLTARPRLETRIIAAGPTTRALRCLSRMAPDSNSRA